MSLHELCNQWSGSPEAARERLLTQADALPEAFAALLEMASGQIASAPAGALPAAEMAAALAARRDDWLEAAMAWRVAGQAQRVLGRHAEALAAFQFAAGAAQKRGDRRLAAQVQIGAIDSLGMLGRYEEAVSLARHLEIRLREEGAEAEAAKVLFNVGSLHFRRDHYALALACYQQAGLIFQQAGDPLILARVKSNCANALTHLNRTDEAIGLYEEARAVFAAMEMPLEAAVVDTNIGYLYSVSGQHARAVASLTRAHREFTQQQREHEAARCDIDLAEAYRNLNLFPEALTCYGRALEIFARLPLDYDRARGELGRAVVYIAKDQSAEAMESLQRADQIFRAQKNTLQRAHIRLIRASFLRAQGRTEEAGLDARRAARTLQRNGLEGWAAEAEFVLADMALDEGQNAVRRMHRVARVARKAARGWLECRAERALGLYYARRADRGRALRHFRAGVTALEAARTLIAPEELHVAFLRDKQAIYEDLIGTLLNRGRSRDILEALEYVERGKSRLLLERIQAAIQALPVASETVREARARVAALRAALSRSYHRIHALGDSDPRRLLDPNRNAAAELLSLEGAYRDALRELDLIEPMAAPVYDAPRPSDTDNETTAVCAALRANETLLEYYILGGQVCAFLVTPEGVQFREGLASVAEVDLAARRLRYHLQMPQMPSELARLLAASQEQGAQVVLERLYDLLLRPLEAQLAEHVVVIPHGLLHGLPFHAFYDGTGYALDRREFLYAPSATIWLRGCQRAQARAIGEEALTAEKSDGKNQQNSAQENRVWIGENRKKQQTAESAGDGLTSRAVLVMGIPEPGIERVADEVTQLGRCLPDARVFCGEAATLATFQEYAGQSRILHLATHALFRNDNPLFSGLRFADGWLLARDLYDMTLCCELATLSACHTGVASVEAGDELFGLIRGFLAAGAQTVAASLWPADDAATAYMMGQFYAYLEQGAAPVTALRKAQSATRELYSHPYYWAAFALIGERGRSADQRNHYDEKPV